MLQVEVLLEILRVKNKLVEDQVRAPQIDKLPEVTYYLGYTTARRLTNQCILLHCRIIHNRLDLALLRWLRGRRRLSTPYLTQPADSSEKPRERRSAAVTSRPPTTRSVSSRAPATVTVLWLIVRASPWPARRWPRRSWEDARVLCRRAIKGF